MIWKPKERQLTREEAIDLAKKELKPLWFGSEPLLAGVRSGTRANAHPLDAALSASPWLISFVDAASFEGHTALETISIWNQRYGQLGVHFLVILRFPSLALFRPAVILDRFEQELAAGIRFAVDHDGALSGAFGFTAQRRKSVILLNGKPQKEIMEPNWALQSETAIQHLLREKDTGLPLLPPLEHEGDGPHDLSALDFGTAAAAPASLQFVPSATEKFSPPAPGHAVIIGEWTREADRITTSDPAARIVVRNPGSELAVLAQPVEKAKSTPHMVLEINGMPVYEEYFGPSMAADDDARTQVPLGLSWFYRPVKKLPEKFREITISFPDSKATPTTLFGLRFGS